MMTAVFILKREMKRINKYLVYHYIHKPFLKHPNNFGYAEKDISFINKVFRISIKFIKEIYYSLTCKNNECAIFKNKVVFISLTNNQFYTIEPIQNKINNSVVFSPLLFSRLNKEIISNRIYIKRLFYLYDLICQNYFFIKILKVDFFKYFIIPFYNAGFYNAYCRIFKNYRPSAIVFSNDNHPHIRSFVKAAKFEGIPTIYIQHCTASNIFPIIDYDYGFLEGQYSIDTYSISLKSKIRLVGMPKFDKFSSFINTGSSIKTIGVAINAMDNDNNKLSRLFYELHELDNIKIIFRPHPALCPFNEKYDWDEFSDPNIEKSFDFFKKIDVLIAGNSSIHQEAALLNITCFHLDLTKNNYFDYFDFIKNGVCIQSSIDEIANQISYSSTNRYSPLLKVKYYNDVVDTRYFGKSTKLVVEEILKII
jgi:hypothetical protein